MNVWCKNALIIINKVLSSLGSFLHSHSLILVKLQLHFFNDRYDHILVKTENQQMHQ